MRARNMYSLAGIVVLSVLVVLLLTGSSAGQTDPPASGDWTVSDTTIVRDRTVDLRGNLRVATTGSLTLDNVSLRIHLTSNGQYGIEVQNGGSLVIRDGDDLQSTAADASRLDSVPTTRSYYLIARPGASLRVTNSFIYHCGHTGGSGSTRMGVYLANDGTVIDGVVIEDGNYGLVLRNAKATVRNSIISNHTYHGVDSLDSEITLIDTIMANNGYEGARIMRGDAILIGCQVLYNRDGLMIRTDANVTMSNTTVKGNNDGIYMEIDSKVEVINCTFQSQSQYGIHARDRGTLTIRESIIGASTNIGLRAYNQITIMSSGNIYRNNVHGIFLRTNCYFLSIDDSFRGNSNSGINLNTTSDLVIIDGYLFGNNVGVKGEGDSSVVAWSTTVEKCTFEGYKLTDCDLLLNDGAILNCTGGGIMPTDDSSTEWIVHAGNSSALVNADSVLNGNLRVQGDLRLESVTISFYSPSGNRGIACSGGQQDWSNVTIKGEGTSSIVALTIDGTASGSAWYMTLEDAGDSGAPTADPWVKVPFEFHRCTFKDGAVGLLVHDGGVVLDRCTFTGNGRGAMVVGAEVTFANCTFSANSDHDVSVSGSGHAVLVNSSFNPARIQLAGAMDEWSAWWVVHVHVKYPTGGGVAGAQVVVTDVGETQVAQRTTGSMGKLTDLLVLERTLTGPTADVRTPHTFNATSGGSANETQVTVDSHMTITLVLQDSDPPVLNVTSHSDGDYIDDAVLVLRGTATDAGSSIYRVEARVATQPWMTCTGTDTWEWTYSFTSDNTYPIIVRARDMVLNEAFVYLNLTLDTRRPEIEVTSPPNGSLVSTEVVTIVGWVDDPDTVVTAGNSTAEMDGTRFYLNVTVQNGPNLIAIHAVDLAGNEATLHWSVPADLEAPPLTIFQPLNGSRYNTTQVILEGSTGPYMDVYYRVLEVDNVWSILTVSSSGDFAIDLMGLPQGINTLEVKVTDNADNEIKMVVLFTVDTQAPRLLSVDPADGEFVLVTTLNVTGTFSERLTSLTIDDVAADLDGVNFSIELEVDEDTVVHYVRAVDELGNVAHLQLRYYLDQTPPHLNLQGFTFNEETGDFEPVYTNQLTFLLMGNTELGATVYIEGWNYEVDELGRFQAGVDLMGEGENVFQILVRDRAGNELETTITLILDTSPPELVVKTPEHMSSTDKDFVWVEGTVSKGDRVTIGEEVIESSNGTFRIKVGLEETVNQIVVTASDKAGNEEEVQRLVFMVEDTEGLTGYSAVDNYCNTILVVMVIVIVALAILSAFAWREDDVIDRREKQLESVLGEDHIDLDRPHLEPTTGQLMYDPTSPTGRRPEFEERDDEEFISMSDFKREYEKNGN